MTNCDPIESLVNLGRKSGQWLRDAGIATIATGPTVIASHPNFPAANVRDLIAMARELMYSSDWPAHAAKALNVPNYLELFPPEFTHRLKLREEHVAMPENRTATGVPIDLNS